MPASTPSAGTPRLLERFTPRPDRDLPPPEPGAVDVWRVPLDPAPPVVEVLRDLLSPDERERADRFHFDRHRRRFTVGRAALRRLLGGYLGEEPKAIELAYGERDKPYLPGQDHERPLQFNLSNSSELALIAVTVGPEVGVDLEALRPMEDALAVSERFFSPSERRALAACATGGADERDAAFFRCWTRKEAYVKAVGDGIALGLDRFDVSLEPREGARFLALEGDPERARAWTLVHIEPAPGYVGALALPARPSALRGWHWEP